MLCCYHKKRNFNKKNKSKLLEGTFMALIMAMVSQVILISKLIKFHTLNTCNFLYVNHSSIMQLFKKHKSILAFSINQCSQSSKIIYILFISKKNGVKQFVQVGHRQRPQMNRSKGYLFTACLRKGGNHLWVTCLLQRLTSRQGARCFWCTPIGGFWEGKLEAG